MGGEFRFRQQHAAFRAAVSRIADAAGNIAQNIFGYVFRVKVAVELFILIYVFASVVYSLILYKLM